MEDKSNEILYGIIMITSAITIQIIDVLHWLMETIDVSFERFMLAM